MWDGHEHQGRIGGLSVVIPAHNEAGVLPWTLRALVDQEFTGQIDIIVVANGCTDDTAAVARSFVAKCAEKGASLRVCELPASSKPAALNRGDELRNFDCVMYLDADVVLSANAVEGVYRALNGPDQVPIASPRLLVAPSRSAATRAYGRVWSRLPYVERRVRGVGCYAVSAEGRSRWGPYPQVLADDHFARLHFGVHEQRMIETASYTWPLPEGPRELVRVRSRWLLGNSELRQQFPELAQRGDKRYDGLLGFVVRSPGLWPDVAVFVCIYGFALARMWTRRRAGDRSWDRAVRARAIRLRATELTR